MQAHDHFTIEASAEIAKKCDAKFIYDAVEVPYSLTENADQAFWQCAARWLVDRDRKHLKNAGIITVSPGLAEIITKKFYADKPLILRNCCWFSTPGGSSLKSDIGLSESDKVILYLNSIVPNRGLSTLLKACSLLPKDMHVVILGPSPDKPFRNSLIQLARDLKVSSRVHFPVVVQASKVVWYASGADIGVVPTKDTCLNLRHCLPNRLMEMIMARLPLVVSDLPDMKALVQEQQIGLVFPYGDVEALAAAIFKLLSKEKYQNVKNNIESAAVTMCWEKESECYLNALNKLLS